MRVLVRVFCAVLVRCVSEIPDGFDFLPFICRHNSVHTCHLLSTYFYVTSSYNTHAVSLYLKMVGIPTISHKKPHYDFLAPFSPTKRLLQRDLDVSPERAEAKLSYDTRVCMVLFMRI